jgi:riboflavin kinase/FMN adenylyltransferase
MENMGIQNLVIHPFDTVFSQLTAEEFVRTVLVNQFDIHKIIIGHDHRFGRDRTANIDDLISFGNDMGLRSSRYVKKLMTFNKLNQNQKSDFTRNMPLANEYLGTTIFYLELFSKKTEPLGSHRKYKIEEDYKLIPITVFMW